MILASRVDVTAEMRRAQRSKAAIKNGRDSSNSANIGLTRWDLHVYSSPEPTAPGWVVAGGYKHATPKGVKKWETVVVIPHTIGSGD